MIAREAEAETGYAAARPLAKAAAALLRELTDVAAYRSLAVKVKYPVAAMLISQTVLGFGVTAVLARALGRRGFGEYALVLTIAGIFQLVAAFPVESGIPKFLAEARQRQPDRVGAYYTAGLWCRLGAGLLAVALSLGASGWLSQAYRAGQLHLPVLIGSLYLCLLMPLSLYFMACLQGMERPARWATGNLLTALAVFPLLLVGALGFPRWGQQGLFSAIAVGWLASLLVCGWLARGPLGALRPTGAARAEVGQLVPFLLPIWLVPLGGFGARTLMKSVLAWRWGTVPLGQFEIALTLLAHLAVIYQGCMIVLLPEWARLYARREGPALIRSLAQARGVLVGAAVVYGAALVFGGRWVVPAIFGVEQAGSVAAAQVIGVVMPVMISGWVASATNVVSDRTATIGKANLIWFAAVVPLGLALIPPLGSLGAALAWLGAYSLFAWYYITRARPFYREVESWARQ